MTQYSTPNVSIPDLCGYCSRIPFDLLHADSSISFGNNSTWDIGTASRIRTSTCPVCRLVSELLYRHAKRPVYFNFNPDSTLLSIKWDYGLDPAFPSRKCFLVDRADSSRPGHAPIGLCFLAANHRDHGRSNYLHYELSKTVDIERTARWIDECSRKHQCVVAPAGESFEQAYPGLQFLRCIDVKLNCVVELNHIVPYVALSYVWGSVPNFRITKANRKELQYRDSINKAWNLIPETIRDAITLTRKLGLRYLWVDSLCLVQNDPSDLEPGIELMDQVYERAWVTVVAASGFDANAGLPGIETGSREVGCLAHEIKPGIFLGKITSIGLSMHESPHMTRAWTLQERILSRRNLYFFRDQVVFRCNRVEYHERLNDNLAQFDQVVPRAMDHLGESAFTALRVYGSLIRQYSGRSLGNDADVLRAMGGIMRRVSIKVGYPVVQGLPVAHLDIFLLFKGNNVIRRPGFPSYSWAGWRGEVRMIFLEEFESQLKIDEWLESHRTWIVWYTTDSSGRTTSVIDQINRTHHRTLQGTTDWRAGWLYHNEPRVSFQGFQSELSLETLPTPIHNPKPYPILRFWTWVLTLTIQITDVFTSDARLLGANGEDCGWMSLDDLGGSESDIIFHDSEPIEVVLLSEGCPQKTFRNDQNYVLDTWRPTEVEICDGLHYNVILVKWDGGIAERRGYGWIRKKALHLGFGQGPRWKEINLG
ncbi:hypothetical protein QC761_0053600 [Podospora bellae-mahoneyi]|uniref:Heterokaryon incompatibility domain-containing protein n=1 Tax=Podospora bellae-mahoneyi TaxID=2093777 RepID=A0ABR0FNG3_9PEZI|nr:hypothetical protein QC761_0053600 [Podospora bellae-mahoneyi]